MVIKTTGAELKQFWQNEEPAYWPKDSYVDCMFYTVNGDEKEDVDVENLNDTDVVTVSGVIMHGEDDRDFSGLMKKWRKAQTTEFLVIEVPKDNREAILAELKKLGVKVQK